MTHIVLVGLPGAGKSVVGARLADRLGRMFLDFDVEISRREQMSIAEIFAQGGEEYFRGLEHRLTLELRASGNLVLAPGGGWVSRLDSVSLLRPPARLIYLKVSPTTAIRRMDAGLDARPLLQHPRPDEELDRLFRGRRSAYESADFVVDVETLTVEEVTDRIVELLKCRAS
jgi:shikimate kinase